MRLFQDPVSRAAQLIARGAVGARPVVPANVLHSAPAALHQEHAWTSARAAASDFAMAVQCAARTVPAGRTARTVVTWDDCMNDAQTRPALMRTELDADLSNGLTKPAQLRLLIRLPNETFQFVLVAGGPLRIATGAAGVINRGETALTQGTVQFVADASTGRLVFTDATRAELCSIPVVKKENKWQLKTSQAVWQDNPLSLFVRTLVTPRPTA